MPVLPPPSFLGKKVFTDEAQKEHYIVKYEDKTGKRSVDVLLFDHEVPVIFATMDYDGNFLESFYLSSKTTKASSEATEAYKLIHARKKEHRITQDDLKDALKSRKNAKRKNKKILKLLRDEHLEDIKNRWPSRMITLQREFDGEENSLIMETLEEAIETANPKKAYVFLKNHRVDSLIPMLGSSMDEHPELLEKMAKDYFDVEQGTIFQSFLLNAAPVVSLENYKLIEELLYHAEQIDQVYQTDTLKLLLRKMSRRVKEESEFSMREWLTKVTADRKLKRAVVDSLKK